MNTDRLMSTEFLGILLSLLLLLGLSHLQSTSSANPSLQRLSDGVGGMLQQSFGEPSLLSRAACCKAHLSFYWSRRPQMVVENWLTLRDFTMRKTSSCLTWLIKKMWEPNWDLRMRLALWDSNKANSVSWKWKTEAAKEEICWDLAVYTVIFLGLLPNRYSLCLGKTRGWVSLLRSGCYRHLLQALI